MASFWTLLQTALATVVDFFGGAADKFTALFVSGDTLSTYGNISVCVFVCSLVLYIVKRLINFFVRY